MFALLQQYTRYSFAPLVKSFAAEAKKKKQHRQRQQQQQQQQQEEEEADQQQQGSTDEDKKATKKSASMTTTTTSSPSASDSNDSVTTRSLLTLQKKITELDLALAQCQKGLEIPAVTLAIHPDITRALAKAGSGAESEGRYSIDVLRLDLDEVGLTEERLRDDAFLNSLQSCVNGWVKDIQKVTRLTTETPFPETALDEVNFWRGLEEALEKIERQLASPSVTLTMVVLKQARRMIAVAALDNNTGMASAEKVVGGIVAFLRDLPLHPLLAASSLDQLGTAVGSLFMHLNKVKTNRYYDVERAGRLFEELSRAFASQLASILWATKGGLLQLREGEYEKGIEEMEEVLGQWKGGARKFEEMYLELWKRRVRDGTSATINSSSSISISSSASRMHGLQESGALSKLQQRLSELASFRAEHTRFCLVVDRVLEGEEEVGEEGGGKVKARREVEGAYARVVALGEGVLDTSVEGGQAWSDALEGYRQRVDKLENRVVRLLCSRLEGTGSAEEMFRVFARFNPLLYRPRVRAAIAQHQARLIKHVREAVGKLQNKFMGRYEGSEARVTAALRDVPPVAGVVMWARQIERQLRLLMTRMEDLLGAGWENHVEGKQLKGVCEELLRNLDTEALFAGWVKEMHAEVLGKKQQQQLQQHQVLVVGRDRTGAPCLKVNFDESTVMLFKEVRHLQWLGFRIPAAIKILAEKAAERYPYAMALQATLRALEQTLRQCSSKGDDGGEEGVREIALEPLLEGHIQAVREVVKEAFPSTGAGGGGEGRGSCSFSPTIRWDAITPSFSSSASFSTSSSSVQQQQQQQQMERNEPSHAFASWVTLLSERVFALQEKTEDLFSLLSTADSLLSSIQTCPYDRPSLLGILLQLQGVIDSMNLAGYRRIDTFVQYLEKKLSDILKARLTHALEAWIAAFENSAESRGEGGGIVEQRKHFQQHRGQHKRVYAGSSSSYPSSKAAVLSNHTKEQQGDLSNGASSSGSSSNKHATDASTSPTNDPTLPPSLALLPLVVHKILLQNQTLCIFPPLEEAIVTYLRHLHSLIGVVGTLPRLKQSRFDLLEGGREGGRDDGSLVSGEKTFADLPRLVSPALLRTAYECVQEVGREAGLCVQEWLQYQPLWDMTAESVYAWLEGGREGGQEDGGRLSAAPTAECLHAWHRLLTEMKGARADIEMSHSSRRCFPPSLVIDYEQVEGQVNLKYDAWQKEFQARFGLLLAQASRETHAELVMGKGRLEGVVLLGGKDGGKKEGEGALSGVTYLQDMRVARPRLESMVSALVAGERLLHRQRYMFPTDWPQASLAAGALDDFTQILDRRTKAMQTHLPALQHQVRGEGRMLAQRVQGLTQEWGEQKPVRGEEPPEDALEVLGRFEMALSACRTEYDRLAAAKQALCLEDDVRGGESNIGLDPLAPLESEVHDLKEVWGSLASVWGVLQTLYDTPWSSIQPRVLRKSLEQIQEQMRTLPNRVRQYEAFTHLQGRVRGYQALSSLISDLKTEALKDRHWRGLLKRLRVNSHPSSSSSSRAVRTSSLGLEHLTLGHLWSALDPLLHRSLVSETLTTAQGEMALEIFLGQVQDIWETMEVELSSTLYRGRVRLIKGWEVMFAKLEEHLNALAAMRLSPYFGAVPEFQRLAGVWEERLSTLKSLLDIWIQVQKKWVYLEGIFLGGSAADIKNQMPSEHARFKALDTEFVALLRRVAAAPRLMEVVMIEYVHRQLERQDAALHKIQKALGAYLKRQRAAFSRFYFVGDEDLLEIVGNASEPSKVTQHLSKMFASLAQVRLETREGGKDGGQVVAITAMMSKEGEEVTLRKPVIFHPAKSAVRDWLQELESEMRATLAYLLAKAVEEEEQAGREGGFVKWVETYPAQVVLLAVQIWWTRGVEAALLAGKASTSSFPSSAAAALESGPLSTLTCRLVCSVQHVLAADVPPQTRKKFEHLITELVHQRDVIRSLLSSRTVSPQAFAWLQHLRFYWRQHGGGEGETGGGCLHIQMANADFSYGFEYLGMAERLVQTPLTHKCNLTLTQALHHGMGGNPFGPAGTGKTESVKALGAALGRFVLVFNCDEHFDYSAMGRLLAGLCQVGAWGCFDEFNRLEEQILSAVSQQLQTIQKGLASKAGEIDLLSRGGESGRDGGPAVALHPNVGVFVTMNPGYAGRSHLPDNLKALFRSVAMTAPDRGMIAEVMLYAQGLESAEALAKKVVVLFQLCEEQLSRQSHYDFGLRALKTVLVGAGGLKRRRMRENGREGERGVERIEARVLVQSTCATVVPKLVSEDLPVFKALLKGIFPQEVGEKREEGGDEEEVVMRKAIAEVCERRGLVQGEEWMGKVLQLRQVLSLRHGVMLVGPTGSGKTTAWSVLLEAESLLKEEGGRKGGKKGQAYVIDPKALSKEQLFGSLDNVTLEWTDGIFTSLLRQILENARGEQQKRQWVVFDGDVDPDWAENLNSVLDDNKLLTLPSGERLEFPENVRILFEVDSLAYVTPATVSRCGMVWFAEEGVSEWMVLREHLERLRTGSCSSSSNNSSSSVSAPWEGGREGGNGITSSNSSMPLAQTLFVKTIEPWVLGTEGGEGDGEKEGGLVSEALQFSLAEARKGGHVMETERGRLLETFFSLLRRGIALAVAYDEEASPAVEGGEEGGQDGMMRGGHMEKFALRYLFFAALWGLGSSLGGEGREAMAALLLKRSPWPLPPACSSLLELQVRVEDGEWVEWSASVPRLELEAHSVVRSDLVIPTTDTVRHIEVLRAWLASRQPFLLCGPPGSGKSMTLTSALRSLPDVVLASLNFSSGTGPDLLLKTFVQYCEYVRTPRGVVLQPSAALGTGREGGEEKRLVIFCDEINLPEADKYGTQRVLALLRQCTEQGGFWRAHDNTWVKLNRIQFVGACNPPTDAGRVPLPSRFLRHAPVLFVDVPSPPSLRQIYRTYTSAVLKLQPALGGFVDPLTDAMLDLYMKNQSRFTADMKPQYVYSPRELSRWVRALYEALGGGGGNGGREGGMQGWQLVRVWAHEGLRLFCDRLASEEEREWCQASIDDVARHHFAAWVEGGKAGEAGALARPIMYSKWLSRGYRSVEREELRMFVAARLKVFYEEELDVPLVIFDDVLEHILRIDGVLRQAMGHLLLVGESGVGKTVLSRFVAWMNGLSVFQVKEKKGREKGEKHNKYAAQALLFLDSQLLHTLPSIRPSLPPSLSR